MSLKLSLLTFTLIGSFSSFAMAEDQTTNKTCSGRAWITSKESATPKDISVKLERTAGNTEGVLTMTLVGMPAVGSYSVSDDHLEATFEISDEDMLVTGKIMQVDNESVTVTGTLTFQNKEERNLLALDLKCSNN